MLKTNGFNLTELMITIAIIGIVIAIGLPVYSKHLITARRLEAETGLVQLASALEKYYLLNNTYENVTLEMLDIPEKIANNAYQVQIASATSDNFSIAATPINNQAEKDLSCATLLLDSSGKKQITGTGNASECWENHI
jgi:type IV pilus assembly protein PilE